MVSHSASWRSIREARLRYHPRKRESLKRLVELVGVAVIGSLSAAFLVEDDRIVDVPCGQDLDATVNADDATVGARFQLAGGCTYTVGATVVLK